MRGATERLTGGGAAQCEAAEFEGVVLFSFALAPLYGEDSVPPVGDECPLGRHTCLSA